MIQMLNHFFQVKSTFYKTYIKFFFIDIKFKVFLHSIINNFSRNKRIAELKRMQQKAKFDEVIEITGQSWKKEVNEAGEDIVVIVHLYNHSYVFKQYL